MNRSLRIAVVAVIMAMVGILLWWHGQDAAPDAPAPSTQDPPRSPRTDQVPPAPDAMPRPVPDPSNPDPRFTRFSDGTIHLASAIAASRTLHRAPDPRSDLDTVAQLIGDYRLVYRENPVGTENAEIIAQLLGSNPKKIVFIDPALTALTTEGQLLDRWGSPYIFHPLRSDLMDIRSLGPDRKPWTGDDLSLGFEDVEDELQLRPASPRAPQTRERRRVP